MEERHRDQIMRTKSQIIQLLNYDYFKELCIEFQIITDAMLFNIEEKHKTSSTEKIFEALLEKITKRGPDVYVKFVKILLDICDEHLNLIQNYQKIF